jgi:hypothetical protein
MKTRRLSILGIILAAAILLSAGVAQAQPASLPSDPVPNPATILWFPQTQHTLHAAFREYWSSQGGLARFGYPLTEEFPEQGSDGNTYTVQYFERARFEWHPQNHAPYTVLLGLLGKTVTAARSNEIGFQPTGAVASQHYFTASHHNVPDIFYQYWVSRGGLAIYGYPISEAIIERNAADGKFYQVQYFERNRFEYHPENPPATRIRLGLLGTEILKARGWIR